MLPKAMKGVELDTTLRRPCHRSRYEAAEREGDDELSLSWAEPRSLLGDEGWQAIMSTTDESQTVRMLENAGVPPSLL